MKFGGTSVADADAIGRLAAIVRRRIAAQPKDEALPIVVVSALAKTTDRLLEAARLAERGDADRAAADLNDLLERHIAVATALTTGARRANVVAAVVEEFASSIALVRALAVLREVSPRSLDAVVAAGELASSRIVAAALAERDIPAMWIDARSVIVTDGEHTAASPQINSVAVSSQGTSVGFHTFAGQRYLLEFSTNLSPATWVVLPSGSINGNGQDVQVTDTNTAGATTRFYRLKLLH